MASDVTEAVNSHVRDWSKAAVTSLQRRRIDKIAVVSLDVILLDHAHFNTSVAQVSQYGFLFCFSFKYLSYFSPRSEFSELQSLRRNAAEGLPQKCS